MPLRTGRTPSWLLGVWLLAGCGYSSDEALFGVIDDVPPQVQTTIPGQDWIQVPTSITVRVWFSEAVDPASVGSGSIQLISGQHMAAAGYLVKTELDGRGLVTIDPRNPLLPGVEYLLWISRGVTDLYGNPPDAETRITFRTLR